MKRKSWSGSMTVEAAIVMPIFVVVVFTMILLTKLVYVQALVQQGLVQTAKEVSTYSYILKEVFGVDELHGVFADGLQGNINSSGFNDKLEKIGSALDGNTESAFGILDEILADPVGYGEDMVVGSLSSAGLNVYMDLLGEATGVIARKIFPNYVKQSSEELNSLLLLLGVKDGLDGIRMKGQLPQGQRKTLDIVAAYEVDLDPPLGYFLNGKVIIQSASCVPWMGS